MQIWLFTLRSVTNHLMFSPLCVYVCVCTLSLKLYCSYYFIFMWSAVVLKFLCSLPKSMGSYVAWVHPRVCSDPSHKGMMRGKRAVGKVTTTDMWFPPTYIELDSRQALNYLQYSLTYNVYKYKTRYHIHIFTQRTLTNYQGQTLNSTVRESLPSTTPRENNIYRQ